MVLRRRSSSSQIPVGGPAREEERGRIGRMPRRVQLRQIRARQRTYAPPFLMLGVSLQNTTTDEFDFQLAARYLAFDVAGSGSELRVDAAVGVQPNIGFELYRPLGDTPFFVSGSALAIQRAFNFIQDDVIIAKYNGTWTGITYGYLRASISAGNPLLPEASGREVRARIRWLHDNQDSPAVPSGGARANATISYLFDSPEAPNPLEPDRSNDDLMQAEFESSIFWSLRRRDRLPRQPRRRRAGVDARPGAPPGRAGHAGDLRVPGSARVGATLGEGVAGA